MLNEQMKWVAILFVVHCGGAPAANDDSDGGSAADASDGAVAVMDGGEVASAYPDCVDGTLASYVASPCMLSETTIAFTLDGAELAGFDPSAIIVKRDYSNANIPDPHTLLVKLGVDGFGVSAGQRIDVVLPLMVTNANGMNEWLHQGVATGDGVVVASQKYGNLASLETCTATQTAQCDAQQGGVAIPNAPATFLSLITITLDGGKQGSASFKSSGIHYSER